MERQDHTDNVPLLRSKFTELYADSIVAGVYDSRDVDRLESEDDHVVNFLLHQKGDVAKAAAMVDSSFRWRKELGLNDLTEKSFPRELHEKGGMYYHNVDKDGNKILYFRICLHQKDASKSFLLKQFVGWWIDKHFLLHPEHRIVVFMDMTDAGFSNMDMDHVKFQVSCFATYYPALLKCMLVYEMPWVLNAIWKVIKTLLSAEQQKYVHLIKKGEIGKYIDQDQLWPHMGGSDKFEYSYIPSEDSGIELSGDGPPPYEDAANSSPGPSTPRKRVTWSEKNQTRYTANRYEQQDSVDDGSIGYAGSGNQLANAVDSLNIANMLGKKSQQEEDVFTGSLLSISPAEALEYVITDETKETRQILSLTNNTDGLVAFKVKTTTPESYRVRPSTGIIKPKDTAGVNVFLQPGKHLTVDRDKFLVLYMETTKDIAPSQVTELFKTSGKDAYVEHRLRCKLGQTKCIKDSKPEAVSIEGQLQQLSKQVDQMLSSQQRLEERLSRMYIFQMVLVFIVILFTVAIVLSYWLNIVPINKYTVNACMPYHFQ